MDFHNLSRKQLQSLCKKNKIPANITNLAMADALTSLPHVEGLDEFLNPTEVNGGAPDIRHTVSQMKPESTNVNSRVRRGSRAKNVEAEHDNVIVLPDTPVPVPPTCNRRRKALPVSNRRKKEVDVVIVDDNDDDDDDDDGVQLKDVAKTPAAISRSRSRATGQTVPVGTTYNTRRSMRLLEKNMSNMTLTDTQDMARNNLKQEMDSVSDQTHDSAETEEVNDAGKTGELEVSSLENYTELEEVQLVSETDNDVGIGLQADAKEDASGSEDSSELEIGTIQDALSVEAAKDANMPFAEQDDDALSVEVSNEADQYAAGSIPMSSESNDSVNLKELVECITDTDNQGGNEYDDNKDKNNETSDGKYLQSFEHIFDADEKAADEKDLAILEEVLEHLEEDLEAKPEYLEESMADVDKIDDFSGVTGAALAALEVSTESSADKCSMDAENVFLESSLVDVAVHEAEDLMDNPEKLEAEAAFDIPVASYATLDSEMDTTYGDTRSIIDAEKATLESSLLNAGIPEARELKDDYEKLDFKAQAVESEKYSLAEELKDNLEKLDLKAQAEESEEHALAKESEEHALAHESEENPEAEKLRDNSEKVDFKAAAEESEEHEEAEYLMDNSERLDFQAQAEVSEEIATTKQESSVLAETVSVGPTKEQKISDIQIQSVMADQLKGESLFPPRSEMNEFTNEIQTVPKMINTEENMPNANMMKENLSTAELDKKSVRELKKMLKNLTLNGKPNCKSKTTNVVNEVEKKRTALQTLSENLMTNTEKHRMMDE